MLHQFGSGSVLRQGRTLGQQLRHAPEVRKLIGVLRAQSRSGCLRRRCARTFAPVAQRGQGHLILILDGRRHVILAIDPDAWAHHGNIGGHAQHLHSGGQAAFPVGADDRQCGRLAPVDPAGNHVRLVVDVGIGDFNGEEAVQHVGRLQNDGLGFQVQHGAAIECVVVGADGQILVGRGDPALKVPDLVEGCHQRIGALTHLADPGALKALTLGDEEWQGEDDSLDRFRIGNGFQTLRSLGGDGGGGGGCFAGRAGLCHCHGGHIAYSQPGDQA